jgi:hypothetical protein
MHDDIDGGPNDTNQHRRPENVLERYRENVIKCKLEESTGEDRTNWFILQASPLVIVALSCHLYSSLAGKENSPSDWQITIGLERRPRYFVRFAKDKIIK